MKTVSVDEMGNAIQKEFEEYVEHTADEVKKIVKEVADDVTKEIQSRAPVDTGAYKKSWTATEYRSCSGIYSAFRKALPVNTSFGIRTCEERRRSD